METNNRRVSDVQIPELISKVENLDEEVKRLRSDFESHVLSEDSKYKEIKTSIDNLQKTVELLVLEIKEPLELYKTAKYGMSFVSWITMTFKQLAPIIIGLALGYGAYSTSQKTQENQSPTPQIQKGN